MFESIRPALVITRREVRDQLRDWRIIFPVLGLTLFFPFLMNFTARQILNFVQQYGADVVAERLVPFLLMIVGFFPISVSLVIALETFVGEKERGSIEPLLNSPLKDWQLYLGKLLAAVVPPLFSSFLGMIVYLSGLVIKGFTIPEPELLVQITVLTIVQAVVMVSGAVVVSSQATSVRAANLLASFIIIPVALLVQGESILMFWGDLSTLWWVVIGLVGMAVLLVRVGLAHFQREELLGSELDVLNFRWMGRVFWNEFTRGAKSLPEWYRISVRQTLRSLRVPFAIVLGLTLISLAVGAAQYNRFAIPLDGTSIADMRDRTGVISSLLPFLSIHSVLAIFWNNLRVMLLSMIIGMFSFGILGVLPVMLTMGVAGYLMVLLTQNGFSLVTFIGLILPHGIIEIPIAILATAAVLQGGAMLGTPRTEKTVGEMYLITLANWFKVMVGVVVPLMLLAAVVEAWVTPQIAIWLLK